MTPEIVTTDFKTEPCSFEIFRPIHFYEWTWEQGPDKPKVKILCSTKRGVPAEQNRTYHVGVFLLRDGRYHSNVKQQITCRYCKRILKALEVVNA